MTTSHEIAKAANALKLAQQCIRKVLKLDNSMMRDENRVLLNMERQAELEATCVILMRAEHDVWQKYPINEKPVAKPQP